MVVWPQITEPLLRERQAMSYEQFWRFQSELLEGIGTRVIEDGHFERAIGYPWERRPGSCLVSDEGVEDLAGIEAGRRAEVVHRYLHASGDRLPVLTYGANSSPERLALKLAHLPEADHEALIVAGDLEDFDVAPHAYPPLFSSMAATLMPSQGTSVRVAVLFLTPAQFTALWWTELTYMVGALSGIRLMTDVADHPIDRVLLFVSRWGAFCVNGDPVAMAAIPAENRTSPALTQIEILDAAASMALGDGAGAHELVKAAFENPASFMADHFDLFRAASQPFESEHWTPMPVEGEHVRV